MLQIILLLATLAIIDNVNARTCICAEFIAERCDNKTMCTWHHIDVGYGAIKGNHGICRSLKWMECHYNPNCTIPGNNPQHVATSRNNGKSRHLVEEIEDIIDAENYGTPSPTGNPAIDYDWPWNCDEINNTMNTTKYHPHLIHVRSYQLMAKKSAANIVNNARSSMQATETEKGTASRMTKIFGLGTFGILISVAVCWKFGKGNKNELIPLKGGPFYDSV